jgi:hypothetical protein
MKKKFGLSENLVDECADDDTSSNEIYTDNVNLTIKVPKKVRNEMKTWCAKHDKTLTHVLKEGFHLYTAKYEINK